MTTTPTDSADELARLVAEYKKLGMELAHVYSFVGDDSMPISKARFESAVDALAAYRTRPAPETAGEAVAWMWEYDSAGHAVMNRRAFTLTAEPTTFLRNVFARGPWPLYTAPAPAQRMSGEQERKAAEHAYTAIAFNYAESPIGSRDWYLFWDGWQEARAAWGVKLEGDAS